MSYHYQRSLIGLAVAATFAGSTYADTELEKIQVTAQKRSQPIQEVPVAISALSEAELARVDPVDTTTIISRIPGLTGGKDADSQVILTVRGVGTNAFSPGADNSVGTYYNEVPVSRNIGNQGLMDVQRIEVVKGPQGTLFGRNTSAGSIAITNNPAALGDQTLSLRGFIGNDGQLMYQVVGNTDLTDEFAVRIAARHEERDGTYTNSVTGDELNGRDNTQVRLSAYWEPTESTNVNFFWEERSFENRWQMVDLAGVAESFGFDNGLFNDEISIDPQPKQTIDSSLVVLKVTTDFDDLTLTATTGFYDADIVALPTDADTLPLPIVDFREPWDISQFSQEFRINGYFGEGSWFVGASFYSEDAAATTFVDIYEDPGLDVLFNDEGLCGLAADFGLGCGIHREQSFASNETTSYAVFGDLIYPLSEKLTLTMGARFTKDEKDMVVNTPYASWDPVNPGDPAQERSTVVELIGAVTGTADNAIFLYTPGEIQATESWTSFDPRVVLDYKFSSDTMGYVNYSKGFKSGGFNRQPISTGSSEIFSFEPEENDAFELGIKSDVTDSLRLNVSAFRYDYTNFQLETNDNGAILIQNAADLVSQGLEIEGTALIGDNFELRFGLAFLDAEFDAGSIFVEGDAGIEQVSLVGKTPTRAPEFTGNLMATYYVSDELQLRAEYLHTGEQFFTALNDEMLSDDGHSLFNARIDWKSADESYGISLIGENLTDEEYTASAINFLFPIGQPGRGRSVRLEFSYNFMD